MTDARPPEEGTTFAEAAAPRWQAYIRRPEVLPWVWFLLFLVLVSPFKVQLSADSHNPGTDGGYYTEVAQHVRDGEGLKTNQSLYHQGYPNFPHPTSIYPLWPLLYGYAGRIFDLPDVGVWLSTAFYFLSLALAFGWLLRIFPGELFPHVMPGFHAAHVFVLLLGLNVHFFRYTSLPYTEGLANVILFGFLLRSKTLWSSAKWWTGAEIGAWLALALLARSQLIILALAAGFTWIWSLALNQGRLKTVIKAVACVATATLLLAPYWYYISSFLLEPGLTAVLRFDQARATDAFAPLPTSVETDGIAGYLADRADGFGVAFGFTGRYAYRNVYGVCHYTPLLAAMIMAVLLVQRIRAERLSAIMEPAWKWLRQRENLHLVFLVVFSLGSFLSLHTIHHAVFIREWVFASRHSLSAMLLFFLALVWLLRARPRIGRVLGAFIFASTVYVSGAATYELGRKQAQRAKNTKGWAPALVDWINVERAKRDPLTVVAPFGVPQAVAWRTPDVYYHWTYPGTTPAELKKLFDEFGADLLVTKPAMRNWQLRQPSHLFKGNYRRIARNLSGWEIWEPKGESSVETKGPQ